MDRDAVQLYEDQATQLLRVFERYCMANSRGNYRYLRLEGWCRLLRDCEVTCEGEAAEGDFGRRDAEMIFAASCAPGQANLLLFEDFCYGLQQAFLPYMPLF